MVTNGTYEVAFDASIQKQQQQDLSSPPKLAILNFSKVIVSQ